MMQSLTPFLTRFPDLQWQLPPAPRYADWLLAEGSLTLKLQQHCHELSVAVLREQWVKQPSEQTAWLREVCLSGDGQAWVLAQTWIPQSTMASVAEEVLALGEQPIGLWLFPQQPQRQALHWAFDEKTGCYARRSCWLLKQQPLQIVEYFLPDFPYFCTNSE